LVWVTDPSFPGLSTRTEMFVLLGWTCVVPEADAAVCELPALWVDVCTVEGEAATAVVAPAASSSVRAPRTDARKRLCIASP
jgi:hypothetical protein